MVCDQQGLTKMEPLLSYQNNKGLVAIGQETVGQTKAVV